MEPIFLPQMTPSFIIGAAAVCLVSGSLFNSWTKQYAEKFGYTDEPRHYTTFLRFNAFRTLYIIAMMMGYFVIVLFPDFILLAFGDQIPKGTMDQIPKQINLWAALIITGLVPYFPGIRKAESKLREGIQKKAFTPTKARTFITILKNHAAAFIPRSDMIDVVREKIGKEKNLAADFTHTGTDLLRHRWCKLSYLLTMIRRKKEEVEFSGYVECCDRQLLKKLEAEYETLSGNIDKIMDLAEAEIQDGTARDLVISLKNETKKKLDALLENCYRLISCGILTTGKSKQNRTMAFEDFGLDSHLFEDAKPIHWNTILLSCLIIFGTAFIPTLVYYYGFKLFPNVPVPAIYPRSGSETLIWTLLGLFMFGLGLVGSIIVERIVWKEQTKQGKPPEQTDNTILHAFFSAGIGYGISIGILYLYTLLTKEGALASQLNAILLFPTIPAAASFLITYFLENPTHIYSRIVNKRTFETASIGICNAVIGLLVLLVMEKTSFWSIVYIAGTGGLIGAGIGYYFIGAYRIYLRPEEERRMESRYAVKEKVRLVLEEDTLDCLLTSIGASFATVDTPVSEEVTSGCLAFQAIGEIPVVISKRHRKKTVLQFLLNQMSHTKLNAYLAGKGAKDQISFIGAT